MSMLRDKAAGKAVKFPLSGNNNLFFSTVFCNAFGPGQLLACPGQLANGTFKGHKGSPRLFPGHTMFIVTKGDHGYDPAIDSAAADEVASYQVFVVPDAADGGQQPELLGTPSARHLGNLRVETALRNVPGKGRLEREIMAGDIEVDDGELVKIEVMPTFDVEEQDPVRGNRWGALSGPLAPYFRRGHSTALPSGNPDRKVGDEDIPF